MQRQYIGDWQILNHIILDLVSDNILNIIWLLRFTIYKIYWKKSLLFKLKLGLYFSASSYGYSVDPSFGGKSVFSPGFEEKLTFPPPSYSPNKLPGAPAPDHKPIFERMPAPVAAYSSKFGAVPTGYPAKTNNLVERFRWRFVDYEFPSEEARYAAIAQGAYIPENNLPVGIELWQDKMFISVPRWAGGKYELVFIILSYTIILSCVNK